MVCGLRNDSIRSRLFTEKDLTYDKALQIALSMERAERDATEASTSATNISAQVNNLTKINKSFNKCKHCGLKNHYADNCYFKNSKCNTCKAKGHISTICRKKPNNKSNNNNKAHKRQDRQNFTFLGKIML